MTFVPNEWMDNEREIGGGCTYAGVAYSKVEYDGVDLALLRLDGEDHLALGGELYGVAHQVDDHLPQPHGITHQLVCTRGWMGHCWISGKGE
jgi:hypothetical protein